MRQLFDSSTKLDLAPSVAERAPTFRRKHVTHPASNPSPFSLEGRVALVTGGSKGLGAAFCAALARAGASVAVNGRDAAAIGDVVDGIRSAGGTAEPMPGDLAERGVAAGLIERTTEVFGRFDILLNNAGISRASMIWSSPDDDWDEVIATNLTSVHESMRSAATLMKAQRSGRIINIVSAAAIDGSPGQANYSAAKAGVVGLTKSAALQLARYGVTVNAIAPVAQTSMFDAVLNNEKKMNDVMGKIPMRRIASPHEVAPAAVFLASDAASYTTGLILLADGGLSM